MHLQRVFAGHRAFVSGESERLFDRRVALHGDDIERVISMLQTALGSSRGLVKTA
jgi:hypothetical protein